MSLKEAHRSGYNIMLKKIIPNILLWAIVTSIVACSYAADYIEGAMTNRASFSISARYESGTGVIVEWNYDPDNESFAGYEIYMTEEPDNEFADMIIVGAGYNISSASCFQEEDNLKIASTTSFVHLISKLPSSGIYFYRVGVVNWKKRDYDGDGKDDNSPSVPTQSLYESYTEIDAISGSAIVEIY